MAIIEQESVSPSDWPRVLQIAAGHEIELVSGGMYPGLPRFDIRSVRLGAQLSGNEYNEYITRTTGSSSDFGDELRFDIKSGAFQRAVLLVPETQVAWHHPTRDLLCTGEFGLRVRSAAAFHMESTAVRMYHPRGDVLLCLADENATANIRVRIAPDLDLLSDERGIYLGWMLANPACYFADRETPVPSLGVLVGEYYNLVNDQTLDGLNDKDSLMYIELERLRQKASSAPDCPARRTLIAQVDDILGRFYGDGWRMREGTATE